MRALGFEFEGLLGKSYFCLGAEYPSPKKANLSILLGIYKPKKVKGYLLSY